MSVDVEITQTRKCKCRREVISVTGSCALCISESADAFRDFCDGKITYSEFILRLERKGK